MKRFVHGLLAALVLFGSVSAKTYTNKAFLAPRSHNTNIAMESTTWHKQTALIDEDKFGGTIQATGFYEKSNNKHDLGKYFGVCNFYNGNSIDDFIEVEPFTALTGPTSKTHIFAQDVFHAPSIAAGGGTLADRLYLRPYRESYGARLDYHQKLDKIVKGLFFKVSMPIVHVKTSLGWTSSCCKCDPCGDSCSTDGCCDSSCKSYCKKQKLEVAGSIGTTGKEHSLGDYLTGCVSNSDSSAKQDCLKKMKFHNGNSETGIADIDVMLGYNFLYKPTKHVNVNIGLTIPTGNDPDGDYLWEAIVGNHGHWAFGGGLDAAFQIWKDTDKSLDFLFAFNYRYLFKSSETRCPGFKLNTTAANYPNEQLWGRYILGGKLGGAAGSALFPMANVLTREFNVTPGSHFDGLVALAFNWSNWTFDLGYNLFAKEAEDVSWKAGSCGGCDTTCGTDCDGGWTNDTYGTAAWDFNTTNQFLLASAHNVIQKEDILLDTITNPSVVTHKIYGGAGYAFNKWEYPLMLGIGASYEFATDNDCLEAWSLWGKVGVTF